MPLPPRLVDALVTLEQRLDRIKLAYKERFDRFDPATILPYRGYGRSDLLRIEGRVLEATETGFEPEPGILDNIRNTIRRLETDEIRGARVRGCFGGVQREVQADGEAYFVIELEPDRPVEPGWHPIRLEIVDAMAEETTGPVIGEVIVPPETCDFVVVSDLDDTVLHTGATHRVGMMSTVLLNDAHSRVPFEGVARLYRALVAGPHGTGSNPLFYLSRSARNLYGMLRRSLEHHGLPKGPLLLAEYGLREVLGGDERDHKRDALERLLAFYPDHPFVLVGDSGQRDPELYLAMIEAHPGRIRGVVIRDVTERARDREVHRIAVRMERLGVPTIVAADSAEVEGRAADLGLIHPDRLAGRYES